MITRLGTFGAMVEYGVERRVSTHSTLGATMVVGIPVGVTLRVKLTRASQTYTFPIHLSDEILTQPIFYGTMTPLIVWYSLKKLVFDPLEAKKRSEERQKQSEANLTK
jgi:DnaJ family protein C protein 11